MNASPACPNASTSYGGGKDNAFQTATINGTTYNIVDYGMDESWGPKLDGTPVLHWYNLDPEYADDYLKPQPWIYPKSDVEDFFRTGLASSNNISISGGNENQTFGLSYTNRAVRGTNQLKPAQEHRERFPVLPASKVLATANFNYVKNQSTGRPWTGASNRNIMLEAYQWGQVQVDYDKLREYKRARTARPAHGTATAMRTPRQAAPPNTSTIAFWSAHESYLEENRDRFYGNIGLSYDVNSWLQLSSKVNADVYDYQNQDRIAVFSPQPKLLQRIQQ